MNDTPNDAIHTPPSAEGESDVKRYLIWLCDLCIAGKGGECHTPSCALWMNRAPDIPINTDPNGMCIPVDKDGAPYCQYCGAREKKFCDCVIAENN